MTTALETCVQNAFKLPMYPDWIQDVIRNRMIAHERDINRDYLKGDNSWAHRPRQPEEVQLQQRCGESRQKVNEWIIALEANKVFTTGPLNELAPPSTVRDHLRRLKEHKFITDLKVFGRDGYKKYYQTPEQKILHQAFYANG